MLLVDIWLCSGVDSTWCKSDLSIAINAIDYIVFENSSKIVSIFVANESIYSLTSHTDYIRNSYRLQSDLILILQSELILIVHYWIYCEFMIFIICRQTSQFHWKNYFYHDVINTIIMIFDGVIWSIIMLKWYLLVNKRKPFIVCYILYIIIHIFVYSDINKKNKNK